MKSYSKVTPEGTRDILFEECLAQREIQRRLALTFSLRGYQEVITPGLEYYDVFSLPGAAIPQQEMYKSSDNHGRLLVFRPDSTLPIARMAASRLQGQEKPLRLFYNQRVYRNRPDLSGRNDESAQMGVELMGAGGLRADLEVIATAAEALTACVPDFRIEIGHAGFFRAMAGRLPLSPEQKEELWAAIEAKNYGALSGLLDPLGNGPEVEAVRHLPRLFGGEEALREAERWYGRGEAGEMLSYLKSLYKALQKLGLGNRLMVDLGLVQRNDYYTGVVFSAYVQEHGDAVLMGGRYDGLCEKFGAPMPAVGFAIDLDAAAERMAGSLKTETVPEVLVYGEPGYEIEAQQMVSRLTASGTRCESSLWETEEESAAYGKRNGIPKLICVGAGVRETALIKKEVRP